MFGIVRPCRHRLDEPLAAQWTAHLCGLCLTLRGDHGQFARVVTNYDALLVSVLTDAQSAPDGVRRRTAGPCPLRGMRTAAVARGDGARLAAAVSLVLASAKVRDHIGDGDGLLARRPVALAARRVAANWGRAGERGAAAVGFDAAVLVDAVDRQAGLESQAGPGSSILAVTEPTETATAAAFAHTAVLAGRPANAAPLAQAGRLFGRLAHLLDAVEDREADAASGAWNPLTATGTPLAEARRLADDAVHGIRPALREVDWATGASPERRGADGRLVHRLLAHEVRRSVDRAFGTDACGHPRPAAAFGPPEGPRAPGRPYDPPERQHPRNAFGARQPHPAGRGFWAGCAAAAGLCCTCRLCCADEYEGPWSRRRREGWCSGCGDCDCSCCEACECCECCECCDCGCCDCGCDC
ncbi:DUF5685 family protein [Streptomyces sp. MS06]|uniref:DUF5685 family protein n=1 Tax=Streptomyces sp. MS06 TaxID=3385974 RepID=UPI0039A36608